MYMFQAAAASKLEALKVAEESKKALEKEKKKEKEKKIKVTENFLQKCW